MKKLKVEQKWSKKDEILRKLFGKGYYPRLAFKKILTLYYDGNWWIISQYSGAVFPATVQGLKDAIDDFNWEPKTDEFKRETAKDRFIRRHFGTAYHDRLTGKKVITLYRSSTQWWLVSQYTGALYDVSLKGLKDIWADFKM